MMEPAKKKLLIVLAIACPVLFWRLAALTRYLPSKAQAVSASGTELGSDEGPMSKATLVPMDFSAVFEAQKKIKDGPWGRNPFETAISSTLNHSHDSASSGQSAAPIPPKLRFTGVSRFNGGWMAVVDGSFLKVGEFVQDQYRVTSIDKGSISFESQGWELRYELGQDAPRITRVEGAPK